MMFRLNENRRKIGWVKASVQAFILAVAACSIGLSAGPALAEAGYAVVPKRTIYPGEEIDPAQLEEVKVTNPNIAPGYAQEIEAVSGMVTKKTLIAGRIILVSSLRIPFAVSRGKAVKLVFSNGQLVITASGMPLEDASVGDLVKVRNMDSGVIVSGTVMGDQTVHVVAK